MNGQMKKAWSIPDSVQWVDTNNDVFNAQKGDFMKPVIDSVSYLLNNTDIDVNVLTGNVDLICGIQGLHGWLPKLQWFGKQEYDNAAQKAIHVPSYSSPAAYVVEAGRFRVFTILRAGHMLPIDAPEEVYKIFSMILG